MKREKRNRQVKLECMGKIFIFLGIAILISTLPLFCLLYKAVPAEKLSPSQAVKNYELMLQPNLSFIISVIAYIPAQANEGELSFYMDKDYQSDLFNREKEKIDAITIRNFEGRYQSFIRNFSEEFNDFFYNDTSIDFKIQYIPNYEYYPLLFIYHNGSWHTFVLDDPLYIPPKVVVNEDEISQVKENNSFITNFAFQLLGVGFSFILVSRVFYIIYQHERNKVKRND